MKKKVGVAILGLGVVGGGTYRTLVDHREFYLKTQGVDKDAFLKEYIGLDGVGHIYRYLELGCEEASVLKKERAFLDFLAEIR